MYHYPLSAPAKYGAFMRMVHRSLWALLITLCITTPVQALHSPTGTNLEEINHHQAAASTALIMGDHTLLERGNYAVSGNAYASGWDVTPSMAPGVCPFRQNRGNDGVLVFPTASPTPSCAPDPGWSTPSSPRCPGPNPRFNFRLPSVISSWIHRSRATFCSVSSTVLGPTVPKIPRSFWTT